MSSTRNRKPAGQVALVGAGTGDPGLLAVRATELLRSADLVVADVRCGEALLSLVGPQTEVVTTQPGDLQGAALVSAAKDGRLVVRLLPGDPFVADEGAKEAEAVVKAKQRLEVVPGIPHAVAVPAYAGVAVGLPRTVARVADGVDWRALATAPGALVLLCTAAEVGKAAASLVEHGRKAEAPISVTAGGTTSQQHTVVTTLAAADADVSGLTGDVVAVVGDPVKKADKLSWFESRPLYGWKVLVPRTRDQAGALSAQLRGYGAVPVEVPTIAVEPPRTPQAMDRAIRGLVSGRYAWIAFTSTNAVKAVREKIEELGLDSRALAGVKVACVGEQTAAAVRAWGISPELVPSGEQSSDGLLLDWPRYDDVYDALDRVFLPRADIATETLVAGLVERGWQVDDVTAYRTVRAAPPPADIREAIKTGGFDAVLFTSSSTVRNLVGIAGKPHASSVIAVIGPQTAKTAEELGLRVDVQAPTPSATLLAEALADFGRSRREADDPLPPGKANRAKVTTRAKKGK